MTVVIALVAASCGDPAKPDIFVTVEDPSTAVASTASSASSGLDAGGEGMEAGLEAAPTPILAPNADSSATITVPPTPAPLPTLVPRKPPTPTPTPTPSPIDAFAEISESSDPNLVVDPSCAAITQLNLDRANWDLLRSNTVSDIRRTVDGIDDDQIDVALAEAASAAAALQPHLGPMLFTYETALKDSQGEGQSLIAELRQVEESTWRAVPAAIAAAAGAGSGNDASYAVLEALDTTRLDETKARVNAFLDGGCTTGLPGPDGSLPTDLLLSDKDRAELAGLCADMAADPTAAAMLANLGDICP